MVPKEARDVLGKNEVKRQSVLFEVFKSEKDYVNDLELVQHVRLYLHLSSAAVTNHWPPQVFVDGLLKANPPVISPNNLRSFISEVFGNFSAISRHHRRMLAALLSRQREQHPLVQSVTDIILDSQSNISISNLLYASRLDPLTSFPCLPFRLRDLYQKLPTRRGPTQV